MSVEIETKTVVTVAQMARMVGLSRARFYQLQQAGVFPPPLYDVSTRRPIYVEELQKVCLEVRRRNCGVNGKPVLFYSRGSSPLPKRAATKTKAPNSQHADLVDAVRSLGLTSVTAAQVCQAVQELFPAGTTTVERSEVIRSIFVHLKRRDSTDNVSTRRQDSSDSAK